MEEKTITRVALLRNGFEIDTNSYDREVSMVDNKIYFGKMELPFKGPIFSQKDGSLFVEFANYTTEKSFDLESKYPLDSKYFIGDFESYNDGYPSFSLAKEWTRKLNFMNKTHEVPTSQGIYFARSKESDEFDLIISLKGKQPFLKACEFGFMDHSYRELEKEEFDKLEWGPKIEEYRANYKKNSDIS